MGDNSYTIQQVAAMLGISKQAVHSLIRRNRLHASDDNGRRYVSPMSLAEYAILRLGELEKEQNKLKNLLKSSQ